MINLLSLINRRKKPKTNQDEPQIFQAIESSQIKNVERVLYLDSSEHIDSKGNNPVHHLLLFSYDAEFIRNCLKLFKQVNFSFTHINQNKYNPLQTFFINNCKFHEKLELLELVPELLEHYFSRDQLPNFHIDKDHEYYILINNLTSKEDYQRLAPSFLKTNPIRFFDKIPKDLWPTLLYPKESIYKSFKNGFECQSSEDFCYYLTGRKSKTFKRFIAENVFNSGYDNLAAIAFFSRVIKEDHILIKVLTHLISKDLINNLYLELSINENTNLIEEKKTSRAGVYLRLGVILNNENPLIENWEKVYTMMGGYRFYRLIMETPFFHLSDTIWMILKLTEAYSVNLDFSNFKTTQQLHDYVAKELTRLQNEPFNLNQDELMSLDGAIVLNKYKIVIPKQNLDLILIGQTLNICIGSGYYADLVLKKRCQILLVYLNDAPYGAIEIKDRQVTQSKLAHNNSMPENVVSSLMKEYQKIIST